MIRVKILFRQLLLKGNFKLAWMMVRGTLVGILYWHECANCREYKQELTRRICYRCQDKNLRSLLVEDE